MTFFFFKIIYIKKQRRYEMITKRNVLRKKNWEYTEKFISLTLITVCYVFLFFTSCKPGKQNSINLLLLLLNSLDNKNINAES